MVGALPPPPHALSARQYAIVSARLGPRGIPTDFHSRPRKFRLAGNFMRLSYWYHRHTSFSIIPRNRCSMMDEYCQKSGP